MPPELDRPSSTEGARPQLPQLDYAQVFFPIKEDSTAEGRKYYQNHPKEKSDRDLMEDDFRQDVADLNGPNFSPAQRHGIMEAVTAKHKENGTTPIIRERPNDPKDTLEIIPADYGHKR